MGADLYIPSLHKICEKKFKTPFQQAVWVRDAVHLLATVNKTVNIDGKDVKLKKINERAQALVTFLYDQMYSEGYFRDSYNDNNLLAILGASYWVDMAKLVDKKGLMQPAQIREFINWLEAHKVPEVAWFEGEWSHTTADALNESRQRWLKEWGAEKVRAQFDAHRTSMLAFFNKALELNEAVKCSL